MQKKGLNLYLLDMKYIRDLAKVDDNVMSISPQKGKETRPFVGLVVIFENKKYCIPLTSPKPKHKKMKNDLDFSKIFDKNGQFIGALNFNNMIPVSNDVITPLNIKPNKNDFPNDKRYKELLNNQLDWCNENIDKITIKANKLYHFVTVTPEKSYNLTRRCCNFKKLEAVLEKRLGITQDVFEELKGYKTVLAQHDKIMASDKIVREMYHTAEQKYLQNHQKAEPLDLNAPLNEQLAAAKKLRDECNAVVKSDSSLVAAYIKAKQKINQPDLTKQRKLHKPKR